MIFPNILNKQINQMSAIQFHIPLSFWVFGDDLIWLSVNFIEYLPIKYCHTFNRFTHLFAINSLVEPKRYEQR